MSTVNKRVIVAINILIAFGIGAINKWVSVKASWYAIGVLGLLLIVFLIFHYQRYGTLKDQKRFPSTKENI